MDMTNDSSSISRRSGGVRHPPEADIESIRDLLRGYGSPRGILKELIQNAEDAGAKRMDVLHVPGDAESPQSLLRGSGLLVANDGEFTGEHRDAISQISLGTKGTEDRAIGRFGKGLKSIFAWCEAFFIIARTDPNRWTERYIADLFNPWHGWRHRDWDEEFEVSANTLVIRVEQYLSATYPPGKPWLALWFPLRRRSLGAHTSPEEWIVESFPGNSADFFKDLSSELRALAPSLVALRNIQSINMLDLRGNAPYSLTLAFQPHGQRIPAPDEPPGTIFVAGTIALKTSDKRDLGATLPGAIFAVTCWLGLSHLLGFYFRHVANFSWTYGTLAGFIAFMTWFYWNSFALLVGAELNAELAKESFKGQLPQKEQSITEDTLGRAA